MMALVFKSEREREREGNRIRASIMPAAGGDITLGCVSAAFDIEVDIFLVLPGQVRSIVKFTA